MMTDIEEEAASVKIDEKKNTDIDIPIDFSEANKKLTEGLLDIYQKPLLHVKKELTDLTTKQEICIKQMQVENKKLNDVVEDIEISDLFFTLDIYQKKLANIKKEIGNIHERTSKLKKKALKLQQLKHKQLIQKQQKREQELRREEELIGKIE